jgi:hypothetical protein
VFVANLKIALQAVQYGTGSWLIDVWGVLDGKMSVVYSAINELSKGDLKSMLWSVAWRKVKDG